MVLTTLVLLNVPVGSSNSTSRWIFRHAEMHKQQKRLWTHFIPCCFPHHVE